MSDDKIDANTMTIDTATLDQLRADNRTRVDEGNVHGESFAWGVVVTLTAPHRYGHTVEIVLCETESYARATLAPFHAFYADTARVHILHITDKA